MSQPLPPIDNGKSWFENYYESTSHPQPVIPMGSGANILNPAAQAKYVADKKAYDANAAKRAADMARIRQMQTQQLRQRLEEQQRQLNLQRLQELTQAQTRQLTENPALDPFSYGLSIDPSRGVSRDTQDWVAGLTGTGPANQVNVLDSDELLLGLGNVRPERRADYLGRVTDPGRADQLRSKWQREDQIGEMLRGALADPTIDEAAKSQLRAIANQLVTRDDTLQTLEIQLHNSAVTAAYKRAIGQWQNKEAGSVLTLDGMGGTNGGQGGFYGDPNTEVGNLAAEDLNRAPNIVLERDKTGRLMIRRVDQAALAMTAELKTDPRFAAQMIVKLSAWGAYGGGTDKYAAQRVSFDAAGRPVAATWNVDDQEALETYIREVARLQSAGETTPWNELLDQVSAQNVGIAQGPGYGVAASGGGGGGGYGGGTGGISYTPPDLLKQMINGVARARLGQALSDEDVAAFIADFHAKEGAYVNARLAGLDGTQVDPESAAAAWIESRFRDQMASQAGNTLIMALTSFLMGGGLSAGS